MEDCHFKIKFSNSETQLLRDTWFEIFTRQSVRRYSYIQRKHFTYSRVIDEVLFVTFFLKENLIIFNRANEICKHWPETILIQLTTWVTEKLTWRIDVSLSIALVYISSEFIFCSSEKQYKQQWMSTDHTWYVRLFRSILFTLIWNEWLRTYWIRSTCDIDLWRYCFFEAVHCLKANNSDIIR